MFGGFFVLLAAGNLAVECTPINVSMHVVVPIFANHPVTYFFIRPGEDVVLSITDLIDM